MTNWSIVIGLGLIASAILGFFAFWEWDTQTRFYKMADAMRLNYTKNASNFELMGDQFEISAPYGNNTLCLTRACERDYELRDSVQGIQEKLVFQKYFYPDLVKSLGMPRGAFIHVLPTGQVNTIPISYRHDDLVVNATLHYVGGEETGLPACGDAPPAEASGKCRMSLSDSWVLVYEWNPIPEAWKSPPSAMTWEDAKSKFQDEQMMNGEIDCPTKPYEAYRECMLKRSRALTDR